MASPSSTAGKQDVASSLQDTAGLVLRVPAVCSYGEINEMKTPH